MATLVDITPTSVEFLKNGKIYQITEIMENGKELMITAVERPENPVDELILEERSSN